jgi:hypothetical protein
MKRVLSPVLLFPLLLLFIACSDDAPTSQTPTTGTPTAVGIAAGTRTEGTIGAAGGTLYSSDSLLMLIVPSGALSLETSISIEPITNTAPGGTGRAYRLLPGGLTFAQPAVLSIRYDSSTLSPSSLTIAWQGSDNIWQGMIGFPQGSPLRVIGTITHFTDFALYRRWFILPDTTSVKVRQSASFVVYTTDLPDVGPGATLSPLPNPYTIAGAEVKGWAVDHIPGGNSAVGTIAGAGASANYTAPIVAPADNPVEVEATIDRSSEGKPDIEVTALVRIYDDPGTGESRWEMQWTYIDSITCPTQPISASIYRTLVMRGIDTIVISDLTGIQYVKSATGVFNSIEVGTIGKCADPPDMNWSTPEVTQPPTVTSTPNVASANLEPIVQTPTHLAVHTSALYQYGLARHKEQVAGSDYNQVILGVGAFQFDARFHLPLTNPASFDTTIVYGESLGIKLMGIVHATLRKLP